MLQRTIPTDSIHLRDYEYKDSYGNRRFISHDGLTKREYFAAMAMQGFLASCAGLTQNPNVAHISLESVRYADELINALNQQQNG